MPGRKMPAMQILMPFLQILERYNGMLMAPVPRAETPGEDPFKDAFKDVLDRAPPALTLVAKR
jgi:hypothetical protein